MSLNLETNKNGFGLLESLVAILVFGVSIILGLNLVVNALRIIKDNQISDQAASFMVSSLEYVKSPTMSSDSLNTGSYSLQYNNAIIGITNSTQVLNKDNCNSSSPFFTEFEEDFPDFCNSIEISFVDSANPNSDYIITSRVVYKLSGGFVVQEIRGFKQRSI